MTLATFRSDRLKSLLLTIILGGPIYYGIMRIIETGGPNFYIYLSLFSIVTIILMINIIPNVIMPLFNKYTELEDAVLRQRIEELARSMEFPL